MFVLHVCYSLFVCYTLNHSLSLKVTFEDLVVFILLLRSVRGRERPFSLRRKFLYNENFKVH